MPLTEVPIDMAQTMIDTEISPAIRAYSIAVAPESSAHSAIRAAAIRSLFTSNPGRMLRLLESMTATGASAQVLARRRLGQQSWLGTIPSTDPIDPNVSPLPSCQRAVPFVGQATRQDATGGPIA